MFVGKEQVRNKIAFTLTVGKKTLFKPYLNEVPTYPSHLIVFTSYLTSIKPRIHMPLKSMVDTHISSFVRVAGSDGVPDNKNSVVTDLYFTSTGRCDIA